jgi:CheY-like chemotaxis protein
MTPARYRLLIVDDDQDTRDFINSSLGETFEIVTAYDGFDALEKLSRAEPDLLLLDIAMPLMNGFETCQAVRKNTLLHDIQVIFFSAKDDAETIKKCYEAGGNLFVKKPIEPERLIRNLNLSLERQGPPRPKKFPIESLRAQAPPKRAAAKAKAPAPKRPASATQADEAKVAPKLKPRVMVVDDDAEVIDLLRLAFDDSFEVVSAENGLQAIERIVTFQPDVMLVDVMMPKMNGFQLCQSLRRNASFKDIPILFLTAKSSHKDRDYANRCGADAFISKPFDVVSLQELINTIAAKPEFKIRAKDYTHREVKNMEMRDAREKRERWEEREHHERYENIKGLLRENE